MSENFTYVHRASWTAKVSLINAALGNLPVGSLLTRKASLLRMNGPLSSMSVHETILNMYVGTYSTIAKALKAFT
jgi:hypothetical protein